MRALLLLLISAASLPASAIELSNFNSGLACTNTRLPNGDPQGWICHSTNQVLVTDQGSCTYNGKERLCTWVGFEFDYRNARKGQKLLCTTVSSKPSNSGNPEGIVAEGVTSEDWELTLTEGDGHFFNPQYMIFNTVDPEKDSPLVQVTTCRDNGTVVFERTLEFIFSAVRLPEA